jgi:hypothetical protein
MMGPWRFFGGWMCIFPLFIFCILIVVAIILVRRYGGLQQAINAIFSRMPMQSDTSMPMQSDSGEVSNVSLFVRFSDQVLCQFFRCKIKPGSLHFRIPSNDSCTLAKPRIFSYISTPGVDLCHWQGICTFDKPFKFRLFSYISPLSHPLIMIDEIPLIWV